MTSQTRTNTDLDKYTELAMSLTASSFILLCALFITNNAFAQNDPVQELAQNCTPKLKYSKSNRVTNLDIFKSLGCEGVFIISTGPVRNLKEVHPTAQLNTPANYAAIIKSCMSTKLGGREQHTLDFDNTDNTFTYAYGEQIDQLQKEQPQNTHNKKVINRTDDEKIAREYNNNCDKIYAHITASSLPDTLSAHGPVNSIPGAKVTTRSIQGSDDDQLDVRFNINTGLPEFYSSNTDRNSQATQVSTEPKRVDQSTIVLERDPSKIRYAPQKK